MSVTTARGGEGRPAQSLSIIVSAAYAAALDIGHRHVRAALCDARGTPVWEPGLGGAVTVKRFELTTPS